jgi:hypothetical protein
MTGCLLETFSLNKEVQMRGWRSKYKRRLHTISTDEKENNIETNTSLKWNMYQTKQNNTKKNEKMTALDKSEDKQIVK